MSSAITRNNTAEFVNTSGDTMTGPLLLPDGSAAAPALAFSSDADGTGTGLYKYAANNLGFGINGIPSALLWAAGFRVSGTLHILWTNGNAAAAADTGLARASAGIVKITDGATGMGRLQVGAGTGTAVLNVGGVYEKFVSGTGVGNTAATTDDPLWTLTPIPAGTLAADGDALHLILSFTTSATANQKRWGITVGGTSIVSSVITTANATFNVIVTIARVDATHVNVFAGTAGMTGVGVNSPNLLVSSLATNTLAIVVTGASPTTGAANDIVLHSGIAEIKQ